MVCDSSYAYAQEMKMPINALAGLKWWNLCMRKPSRAGASNGERCLAARWFEMTVCKECNGWKTGVQIKRLCKILVDFWQVRC